MKLTIQIKIGTRKKVVGTTPGPVPVEKGYYIDAETGLDTNNGLTPETAIKTLAKVNLLDFSGDVKKVFFKRGQSWQGTVTPSSSGSSGNPIIYGAYGTGDNPKIYGSEIITDWTVHSGNIYKATFNTPITQLFLDGKKMKAARLVDSGYSLITSVTNSTVFTVDIANEANDYYKECKVITRTENWNSETHTVTGSTGSTLTISPAPSGAPNIGEGIILMNKLTFLNAPGEWYYDVNSNTVYLWTPNGVTPENYEVRGSVLDSGFVVNGKDYIHVKDIDILQQKTNGIKITGASNYSKVLNCNIEGQDFGIYTETSSGVGHEYSGNTIRYANSHGIFGYHIGASSITDNLIENTGLFENWGLTTNDGQGIAFSTGNSNGVNTIAYNTIRNCSYNGIMWRGQTNIHHNYIANACLAKSDGGAIYTGSPSASGSIVEYNIIDIVVGNKAGGVTGRNLGEGIYLDENSKDITVRYNTVIGCSNGGIFLHKPHDHNVENNTVFDCRYGFLLSNTATGTSYFQNNKIIIAKPTDDYEPRQLLVRDDEGVTVNNNTYINGFSSALVFRANDGSYKNFADWKSSSGHDANSSYDGTLLAAHETQRVIYNASKSVQRWYKNNATTDDIDTYIDIQPFESKYIRGVNIDCVLPYQDVDAPVVTAFTIPETNTGLIVPVDSFSASGDPTHYIITESSTAPALTSPGWSKTIPETCIVSGDGERTVYAWARDAAGNISVSKSAVVTVSFDTSTLKTGMMAGYGFEETSGKLQDLSGNARHATSHDVNVTINQSGYPGKAYKFDGTKWNDARVIIADNDILTPTSAFSMFIWVKLTTTGKVNALVYKGTTNALEYKIIITSANKVQFSIYDDGAGPGIEVIGSTALDVDTDYLIECSASDILTRSTMKIRINGVEESLSLSGTATISKVKNGTGNLTIGGESNIGTYLNGYISQLLLYSRVLTEDERAVWLSGFNIVDI